MKQNVAGKRPRGRPKGSKNRPKPVTVRAETAKTLGGKEAKEAPEGRHNPVDNLTAPRFQPGQSGNPGGTPKGYVSFSAAYKTCGTLSDPDLELVSNGSFPANWTHPRSVQFQVAARAYQKMMRESPPALLSEVADRSDGKVPQTIKQTIELQGIIALPAPRGLDTWATVIDAHLVEAPALPPGSDT